MSGTVRVAQPSLADVAAVRLLAPLAGDMRIRCGPFVVPAGVIASDAALEQEDSDEGRIVREFVREDPWHGMGSVYPGGWMLLARDDDTVVIGQRAGRVGLGKVVELQRVDETFEAKSMGGWQLQPADPSERVEACFTARTRGTSVTVDWMNGQGLDGTADRVATRVDVNEGPEEVHFLLHSVPARRLRGVGLAIAGVGRAGTTVFELSAPLGIRRLLNDQRIPPVAVTVTTDDSSGG